MKFKLTSIFLFILLLCSCDCVINVNGKVLDKETGNPIMGVTVDLLKGADIEKTNAKGIFEAVEVTGFCKDPLIIVSADGYKPFQIEIKKSKGNTQYLVKTETSWINYDQPFYPDTTNKSTFIKGVWIDKWSQDFKINDTLTIYLSKDNPAIEIEKSQDDIKSKSAI